MDMRLLYRRHVLSGMGLSPADHERPARNRVCIHETNPMTDNRELETRFWKHLNDDRTLMLGTQDIAPRPMTAIAEDDRAPLWFFTSADTDLGQRLDTSRGLDAVASFAAKNHALFAMITGRLVADNDRAVIDRLWNPFIAAWFNGKDDPKLRLLRMDATEAHVWLNENSTLAAIKLMLGTDPKESYKDKAGDIDLA
jgi:general stress protein 26